MRKAVCSLAAVFFCLFTVLCGIASAEKTPAKEAVLIVAFGTSVNKARVSYDNVERQIKAAFPGFRTSWAWTAHSLLKTASRSKPALTVQEALARLAADGVKDVSVLSLHIIPGAEYNDLLKTAKTQEGLPKGLRQVRVAPPLLHDTDSLRETAQLLLQTIPAERKSDEAALFVGHGTHHAAGVYYPALAYYLQALDKNAFVGTIEGGIEFDAVLEKFKANGIRKVWMAPLMTVAGDHAANDLFGSGADSWRRRFQANGIQVKPLSKGLGEYPAFVERWISGLKNAEAAPRR